MPSSPYTEEQRQRAVALAVTTSSRKAGAATGIPERTINEWIHRPEYAGLVEATKERIGMESLVLAQLAAEQIAQRIRDNKLDGRSLVMAYGVAVDKFLLLTGEATTRTEVRDIGRDLSDEELRDALRARLTRPSEDGAPAEAAGATAD